jgi:hypothetical protein
MSNPSPKCMMYACVLGMLLVFIGLVLDTIDTFSSAVFLTIYMILVVSIMDDNSSDNVFMDNEDHLDHPILLHTLYHRCQWCDTIPAF